MKPNVRMTTKTDGEGREHPVVDPWVPQSRKERQREGQAKVRHQGRVTRGR